ncbi:MAG: CBS domain-containing protein [Alphaproteobacteria bacterium]|nr:CBS domain-containing protein [Alphaproteobacteria bacterium]
MPCHVAVVDKLITVSPRDSVESVLKIMKKNKIGAVPVVDDKGVLQGVFSMKILLKNLIPVSVVMNDGVQMDIKVGAAPGVAKRLRKVKPLAVEELMDRKVHSVGPDAPIWEGVSLMTSHGGPLAVVDATHKLIGIITYDSLVEALESIQDTGE